VSNFLRRLPLSRLLILCATIVAVGAGATALAVALGTGPVPPPKPLAEAIHDALAGASGEPVQGVSARIQLTDHLLEGANLAGAGGEAGGLSSNPLLSGASGRLWIGEGGRVRLELQSEQGDTQILYDGHTLSMYDAASNTLYRYTLPQGEGAGQSSSEAGSSSTAGDWTSYAPLHASGGTTVDGHHEIPTVAEIQETITHIMGHANLSGAVPTDVAGQPAYSVRISPSHDGGLIGGAELAWDAVHGVPLRLAVYSTSSGAPVIELAATEISYGPVAGSVFSFTPPPGAKVTEVGPPGGQSGADGGNHTDTTPPPRTRGIAAVQAALPFTLDAPSTLAGMARGEVQLVSAGQHPAALVAYGQGLGGIAVVESQTEAGAGQGASGGSSQSLPEELPKVQLAGGVSATELPTPLGTLLQFDRTGVSYLLAGSVTPATAEAAAKGL
jgi:outer membrane lipoprotein-sorting protein